jgi:purine nucleosidase
MTGLPIIIDTDPGVDDAAALLLALASPELDVRAVTVVGGNVPLAATTANALKIVALAGRPDVPVHAGCPGPLVRPQVFGRYAHVGAFDDTLLPPAANRLAGGHAVTVIADAARAAADEGRPITLACLGPLTNVALALAEDARVAAGIGRIVLMGGAFAALGHRTPWAEFNIFADPHAAHGVFASGVPITMVPLDVTFRALLPAAGVARLAATCGAPGRALAALLRRYDRSDVARLGRPGAPLHDAMVPAWLLAPHLFSGRLAAVDVEFQGSTLGHTWADFHGKTDVQPTTLVLEDVDETGFLDLLADRLSRYGDGGNGGTV